MLSQEILTQVPYIATQSKDKHIRHLYDECAFLKKKQDVQTSTHIYNKQEDEPSCHKYAQVPYFVTRCL